MTKESGSDNIRRVHAASANSDDPPPPLLRHFFLSPGVRPLSDIRAGLRARGRGADRQAGVSQIPAPQALVCRLSKGHRWAKLFFVGGGGLREPCSFAMCLGRLRRTGGGNGRGADVQRYGLLGETPGGLQLVFSGVFLVVFVLGVHLLLLPCFKKSTS